MKNSKSAGFDDINMHLIKKVIHSIAVPLVHIVNLSMCTGSVPNKMKIGRIVPVYKIGDRHLFSNHRPITLLPCFSKILEKILYNRIANHINKNTLLTNAQYGFRSNHSCELALIELHDVLLNNIHNNFHSLGIFLDLSKAFDLIDHNILLYKLPYFGIRGVALDWFNSYLQNRSQYTRYNNFDSSLSKVECGIPQGSMLGSLLFLLYINDLCYVTSFFHFVLFADDTNIISSHKDFNTLLHKTNEELCKIVDWFDSNKLVINHDKTCILYFSKPNIKFPPHTIKVKINDIYLNVSDSVKFLGVLLDNQLTFQNHRMYILKKISKNIGIICKLRSILPKKHLFMLYNSLILPFIHYCNITWANIGKSKLEPFHKLQKKALRICTKSPYLAPSRPLFFELKTLNIYHIYEFKVAVLMYYVKHKMAPANIINLFNFNNDFHRYYTRSASQFHLPLTFNTQMYNSFKHVGPKIFNNLNTIIRPCSTASSFKALLKSHFIHKYTS